MSATVITISVLLFITFAVAINHYASEMDDRRKHEIDVSALEKGMEQVFDPKCGRVIWRHCVWKCPHCDKTINNHGVS